MKEFLSEDIVLGELQSTLDKSAAMMASLTHSFYAGKGFKNPLDVQFYCENPSERDIQSAFHNANQNIEMT